jgi:uncharacterized protein
MSEAVQHGFIDVPVDVDSRWWWDGLAENRLLLPRCETCGRHFFPPQPTCPHCGSDDWQPVESSGRAVVYSWVVVHLPLHPAFAEDVPYTIVAAEVDEGVRIFGRLRGGDTMVAPGAPLAACFYEAGGRTMLGFELTDAEGGADVG